MLWTPRSRTLFLQNASNLIRIELPEIDIDENQRRVVEIYSDTSADWKRYRIERYAVGLAGSLMAVVVRGRVEKD